MMWTNGARSVRQPWPRQTSEYRIGCSPPRLLLSEALTGCSAVIEAWASGSLIRLAAATPSCRFIMAGDPLTAARIRWQFIIRIIAAAVGTHMATRSGLTPQEL